MFPGLSDVGDHGRFVLDDRHAVPRERGGGRRRLAGPSPVQAVAVVGGDERGVADVQGAVVGGGRVEVVVDGQAHRGQVNL